MKPLPGLSSGGPPVPGGAAGAGPVRRAPTSWTRGELVGQGAYGSVFVAMDNDTGELIAVKQARGCRRVLGAEQRPHARRPAAGCCDWALLAAPAAVQCRPRAVGCSGRPAPRQPTPCTLTGATLMLCRWRCRVVAARTRARCAAWAVPALALHAQPPAFCVLCWCMSSRQCAKAATRADSLHCASSTLTAPPPLPAHLPAWRQVEENIRSVEEEVALLQQFDHPNIVRYLVSFAGAGGGRRSATVPPRPFTGPCHCGRRHACMQAA